MTAPTYPPGTTAGTTAGKHVFGTVHTLPPPRRSTLERHIRTLREEARREGDAAGYARGYKAGYVAGWRWGLVCGLVWTLPLGIGAGLAAVWLGMRLA